MAFKLTKEPISIVRAANTSSDEELIQPIIKVIAFTIALLFLSVFGDSFAQVIISVYTMMLGGTPINDEAMCDFILAGMKIVMSVITIGLSINLLWRVASRYMRRN